MATIQTMTVRLDSNISGLRQGLNDAENRIEQFDRNTDNHLNDIRLNFRSQGQNSGRGWASTAISAMARGLGAASTAVGNALSGAMKNPYVMGAVIAGATALGLAAAGALTLAFTGAGLAGISAYILKDVPKIKKAFGELKKTAKDVFRDAAEPMVGPIHEAIGDIKSSLLRLKPDFKELFQSVADSGVTKNLTRGFHKMTKGIVRGLTDMMNKAGPVFDGLESMMVDVGRGIGGFFRELGKSGPEAKIVLQDLGKMIAGFLIGVGKVLAFFVKLRAKAIGVNQALTTVWNFISNGVSRMGAVVGAVLGKIAGKFSWLPGKIIGALSRYVQNIKSKFKQGARMALNAVKTGLSRAISVFVKFPVRAFNALRSLGGKLRSRALSAGRSMVNAIANRVSDAIRKVKALPGRAKSALGNLGSKLYNAGRSLISGFVRGIWSKIGDVARAAASVVQKARNFFPFSPAKEGPFSGKGYTTFSGAALVDGFRKGIAGGLPMLRRELDAMYGTVPDMRANVSGVVRAGRSKPERLVLDVTGTDEDMKRLIRRMVRIDGRGDVQTAFGRK